jgi:purine-binding chemotaxis protein CheW
LDLRLRFGFADTQDTEQTCIIVVQVKLPDGKSTPMGLIVDGVEEAVNVAAGDIEQAPEFGSTLSTASMRGMAKLKGRVVSLLEINRALAA